MGLKTNYAYVDGSFNPKNNTYGYAAILVDQYGRKHIIQGRGYDPGMVRLRNVAGEIMASGEVIRQAIQYYRMKYLTIYYDYDGIANWPSGKWKPRNEYTKRYADFVRRAMQEISIDFVHVHSHTGILENEEVDGLAKESVGIWQPK